MRSSPKGFDQAGAGNVFLQHGIEAVERPLHNPVARLHQHAKNDDHDPGQNQQRQDRKRQARVGGKHQDQAADHQQRRARADAQRDLHQPLHGRSVTAEPHEQVARGEPVKIAVGKGLDFEKDGFAQVASDAFADCDGKVVVADGEDRAHRRDRQHDERSLQHDSAILRRDAGVNQMLKQAWDGQVHKDQRCEQP